MGTLGNVTSQPKPSSAEQEHKNRQKEHAKVYDQTSVYGSSFAANELPTVSLRARNDG